MDWPSTLRLALAREGWPSNSVLGGLRCDRWSVDVDARGLTSPVGTQAWVTATVSCTVPLSDVLVPGWPGAVDVRAEASAVMDRYRGRP